MKQPSNYRHGKNFVLGTEEVLIVPPGTMKTLRFCAERTAFEPRALYIDRNVAGALLISAIRVNGKEQKISKGKIFAGFFSVPEDRFNLGVDIIKKGESLEVDVENVTGANVWIAATLYGVIWDVEGELSQ